MARQGDSQLALSTPTLYTDHYLSQRGLHGLSTSAARNVLSMPDHAPDFGTVSTPFFSKPLILQSIKQRKRVFNCTDDVYGGGLA